MRGQPQESRARSLSAEPPADMQHLVQRFEVASESLERAYCELQNRVQKLTRELEVEREQRIDLERLAAMGEMALELAHEIRNPLGSIELYASMLTGEYAAQVVRGVRLLNHTLTNVLQFGKNLQPSFRQISVAALLSEARSFLQPLADEKSIRLELSASAGCVISADAELLHRVLLNLGLNALRATPSGGVVHFASSHRRGGVRIEVTDSGPGIPDDVLSRMFDPSFSTARDGCGLGLPIAKRIVDLHQGNIDVRTGLQGTTFRILLPATPRAMAVARS